MGAVPRGPCEKSSEILAVASTLLPRGQASSVLQEAEPNSTILLSRISMDACATEGLHDQLICYTCSSCC
jgi:hypothetical protein